MVLYTLYSLLLFLLIIVSKGFKKKAFFILSFLVVVLYWGLSFIDAPDTPGYISEYNSIHPNVRPESTVSGHFEIGFIYLMWLFKMLGANYYLFQLVLFASESLLVAYGLKKLLKIEYDELGLFLCLFGFSLPIILLGALRQGITIAIFIFSLHTLLEKKYYYYIVLVAISFFFHKSSVILLLIPLWFFLANYIINRRTVLLILFVIANILHFSGFTLVSYIDNLFSFLFVGDLVEDYSISEYSIYVDSNVAESNLGFLKLLEVDFCFIVGLLVHPKKNDKGFQIISSLFLLFFILNMFAGGIVVHRITYYLQIPYLLLLYTSFISLFSDIKVAKQGQYAFTYLYVLLTTWILSAPFSSTAIHEFHLLDVLGF